MERVQSTSCVDLEHCAPSAEATRNPTLHPVMAYAFENPNMEMVMSWAAGREAMLQCSVPSYMSFS